MTIRGTAACWALVSALLLAVFAACSSDKAPAPPSPSAGKWGQGVNVGTEFTLARAVTGHRVHVVAQKIECTKCHSPTESSMGPPPKPERCAACHEKEGKLEHAKGEAEKRFGAGAKVDCTTCHAFKFDGKDPDEARHRADALLAPVQGGTGPTAMHGIEAFSPADCKRCHETKQGETAAVVTHLTQVCVTCHKPHQDPIPQSAPCSGCHDTKTTHASHGKSPVETCKTCHKNQHESASAARSMCVGCHSQKGQQPGGGANPPVIPATALFAGGHAECTGCHKPHHFESKEVTACTSCHAGKKVIGAPSIPAHNACTNCHSSHNVRGSPANACLNCHKDLRPEHPKLGSAAGCIGCHAPHPSQVLAGTVGASECSSCHKTAHSDQDFHRGVQCEGCHKPHHFKLEHGGVGLCQGCHSERVHQAGLNPGHKACTQCHQGLPHHPEGAKVGCETCHAREHGAVNSGHQRCVQCHEPHSGAQATPCQSCHKEEHRTAPTAHQACRNCHEPHGGVVQKACATCHTAEAKTPHGQVATGCVTCHRPHGPSGAQGPPGVAAPPACTTCHKPATLPGLHAETKHQTCTNCHTGHPNVPDPPRQVCLSCHKDRTEHFPDAPVCSSCHLFTKTK